MRNSRFTEALVVAVLQNREAGAKTAELVRRYGFTEQKLNRRKKRYGGKQVVEAMRLTALAEENRQLKRLLADQALNPQLVQDLLEAKVVTPEQRCTVVERWMESAGFSARRACRYTGIARSSQRSQPRKDDGAPDDRLRTMAIRRLGWGYRRLYRLLRREGLRGNHQREPAAEYGHRQRCTGRRSRLSQSDGCGRRHAGVSLDRGRPLTARGGRERRVEEGGASARPSAEHRLRRPRRTP